MSKHTKGPLAIGKLGNNADQWEIYEEEAKYRTVAVTYDDAGGCNARLMAASSELLAACEAAYALILGDRLDGDDVAAVIREAIAKAKGELNE